MSRPKSSASSQEAARLMDEFRRAALAKYNAPDAETNERYRRAHSDLDQFIAGLIRDAEDKRRMDGKVRNGK